MIRLRNVCVNNLRGVDLDIEKGEWLIFCGLSGSGKSSLAFDTLYAEGQRRYVSSLSPQTRQFITLLDKPEADSIEGIPPAIAVQAFRGNVGRKTTVGNASEVSEYLRLLFCELGTAMCPGCGRPIAASNPSSVASWIDQLPKGQRLQIAFPCDPTDWADALIRAKRNGFARAIVGTATDARTVPLGQPDAAPLAADQAIDEVLIVVDRLKTGSLDPSRLIESLELAFQSGQNSCQVLVSGGEDAELPMVIDGSVWDRHSFCQAFACGHCQREVLPPTPTLFSHTSKSGACEGCDGIGFTDKEDRIPCATCGGERLSVDASCYVVDGTSLGQLDSKSIDQLHVWLSSLNDSLTVSQQQSTKAIIEPALSRLDYLQQVGLGYLSLGRSVRSLSAGEAQRVALTSCLSSTLVNALYVLDEPSVGLHSADVDKLIEAIQVLHQRDNTVVVVDHDEDMIRATPRVIEIGPAAGDEGGEVVFDGSPAELASATTLTADFLAGRRGVSWNQENRRSPRGALRLQGARGHNLKNIDVEFPLGCLTVVTGVSGAGKSSLVQQTLYGAVCQRKGIECPAPLPFDDVFGDSAFDEIVLVDRSPIGRSARSNPVTYVKAFDDIRRCFSETVDAKSKNLSVSKFSFNANGGRCDKCEGAGQLTIDMQFMPEVSVKCDACGGTRYRDEVLSVKYRGKNIADVLSMTVREAFSFFRGQPKVQAKLKSLIDVGLEYIRLGQSATTLSSGEAQRLKLGLYLNAAKSKRALFVLDEPTTGLHMADVTKLLDCFDTLVSVGHSLIVVEHHLRLIRNADWVIDLGPGAAESGGEVVAEGTPEAICTVARSVTGKCLQRS